MNPTNPVMLLPLKPKYIPTTGVRRCWGCSKFYDAAYAAPTPEVCPSCKSEHTEVVEFKSDQADAVPDAVPDWRFCIKCDRRYPTGTLTCSCGSTDTFPCEAATPIQESLFVVPPHPRPNAWTLEWRWKPLTSVTRRGYSAPGEYHPEPPNDWKRWIPYNVTSEKSVRNYARRARQSNPWRSFRVRAVSWNPTPLLP